MIDPYISVQSQCFGCNIFQSNIGQSSEFPIISCSLQSYWYFPCSCSISVWKRVLIRQPASLFKISHPELLSSLSRKLVFLLSFASRAKILAHPAFRLVVLKSRIPSRNLAFPLIPRYISVKSRIARDPVQFNKTDHCKVLCDICVHFDSLLNLFLFVSCFLSFS